MSVRRFSSLLPVVIFFITSTNSLCQAQGVTFRGTKYPVAGNPFQVFVADFNGDGVPDVATYNNNSGTVSVLLGNGDGTFQDAITSTSGGAAGMAVGDVNNDGIPDIVFTDGRCCVHVMLGNGDGTFQAPTTSDADEGPDAIALADFNGDGNLDFVTVARARDVISVFLGNGDGTFQTSAKSFRSVPNSTGAVSVGDFNGDGKLDVITASSSFPDPTLGGAVTVFLGNGDGTIQSGINTSSKAGGFPMGIGDFNNDGVLDVDVPDGFYRVSIMLGNGDGTFQAPISVATLPYPKAVTVADFNGDGNLDFAAATDISVSAKFGNGGGSFSGGAQGAGGPGGLAIATADFNFDGRPDVVVANAEDNSVTVLINSPF